MTELEKQLLTHCGNEECHPCATCVERMRRASDEIERLRERCGELMRGQDAQSEAIAHLEFRLHEATLAGTPYAADRDARNALVVENQRLEGIVDRLLKEVASAIRRLACVNIERGCEGVPEIVRVCDRQAIGILQEAAEKARQDDPERAHRSLAADSV